MVHGVCAIRSLSGVLFNVFWKWLLKHTVDSVVWLATEEVWCRGLRMLPSRSVQEEPRNFAFTYDTPQ